MRQTAEGVGARAKSGAAAVAALAAVVAALLLAPGAWAATFTVDVFDDSSDGSCTPGDCTLREAIVAANGAPNGTAPDVIDFLQTGPLISIAVTPGTGVPGLPAITDPVVIDGTFAGKPNVELNGLDAGAAAGLTVRGGGTTIKGLVINRFALDGIRLEGASGGNLVTGNYVGTDASGAAALGNGGYGVLVWNPDINEIGSDGNTIERNVISGNGAGVYSGIGVFHAATENTTIASNTIGLDVTETARLGNAVDGIVVNDAVGTRIEANVVSANGRYGVSAFGSATGTALRANRIGTNADGGALGNGSAGVYLGAGGNLAGGPLDADRNTIGFNGAEGVRVAGGTSEIRNNSIHSNGTLGIDLGAEGADPNDPGDGDDGANGLQNAPVVTSATPTLISGELRSKAGTQYRVEWFRGGSCDPSGFGEGRTPIGWQSTPATNADGYVTFSFSFPSSSPLPNGEPITATATDPLGNTSEFSNCATVSGGGGGGALLPSTTTSTPSASSVAVGGSVTDTATVTGGGESAPTGTVAFFVCGPLSEAAGCTSGGAPLGTSKTLASGSATSDPFSPSAAGWWCFRAEYSGDAAYEPSSDGGTNECFTAVSVTGGSGTTVEIAPVADAFVRAATPSVNFGTLDYLDSHGGTQTYACGADGVQHPGAAYGYLKFDLAAIPAGAEIQAAEVRLTSRTGFAWDGDPYQHLYVVANDSWTETGLTYDNAPAPRQSPTPPDVGSALIWYGFPVCGDPKGSPQTHSFSAAGLLDAVASQRGGDGTLSLEVFNPNCVECPSGSNRGYWVRFFSREAADPAVRPVLRVTYTASAQPPALLTVNSADDSAEADGVCTAVHCNLREAIAAANGNADLSTIQFAITGAPTITVRAGTPLPVFSHPVVVDGTTQAGGPVVLDGVDAGLASGLGLATGSGGSTIKGLRIQRFGEAGLVVESDGNTIAGNQIGTDGAAARGNGVDGIRLSGASANTISTNLVSGNGRGISILAGSDANLVVGNRIGTNATGTAAVANTIAGILVNASSGNTIGEDSEADRNLVSGNTAGIAVQGGASSANVVRNNWVGVDAAGTGALGNAQGGIGVVAAAGTLIQDNLVSANGGAGISVVAGGTATVVRGNLVGVDASGAGALGNAAFGITVQTDASQTTIEANTVAHNGIAGVSVQSTSRRNRISANSIDDNRGPGIDLYPLGITPNDAGDGDAGANDLQNFPVLGTAILEGGSLTVAGTLDSPAGIESLYTLEFFASPACDATGNGEGAVLLGTRTVPPGGFSATFELAEGVDVGVVTATATDAAGNTSEFSECTLTEGGGPVAPVDNLDLTVDRRSIPAGLRSFALSAIPPDRIPFFAGAPSSSTQSLPAADVPAADVPAADVALTSSPIGKLTAGDVGVLGLVGAEVRRRVLLSSIQGGAGVVAGTSLAGRPFHTLTLDDVFADAQARANFNALTLAGAGLGQTLLRGTRVISLLFGPLTLGQLGASGPSGTSLLAYDLAGGDVSGTGVGSIPAADIPAADIPAADVPAADVPAADVDLVGSRLGDILIRNLASPSVVVDCTRIDCTSTSTKTLRDAATLTPSAIRPGATLWDLFEAAGTLTPKVNLNEIVMAALLRAEYPWGALPIDGLVDAFGGPVARYRGDFDLACTSGAPRVEITLPPGFLVRRGSSRLARGTAAPVAVGDPTRGGEIVLLQEGDSDDAPFVWTGLPAPACAEGATTQHYSLTFDAHAGLRLGDFTSTIRVVAGGGTKTSRGEAPIAVTENWEANDTAQTAASLPVNTVAVFHVSSGIDREYFTIPNPGRGWRTKIYLEHVPEDADFDVVATTSGADSLLSTPAADVALDSVPLTDPGTALSNNPSGTLGAETLQDIPFPSSVPAADVPAADVPAADVPAADVPAADVSAKRGDEDEVITLFSNGEPGAITIGVSGYNASFSTKPATLRIRQIPPPPLPACAPRTFPFDADPYGGPDEASTGGTLPASLPAGTQSLLLVARDRMHDLYGATATAPLWQLLDPASTTGISAHPAVRAQPLYVDADPAVRAAYRAWDANPCAPELANAVVKAINGVVARYRGQLASPGYVVAHGSDEAMPYARVPDLVTLSNQQDYAKSLAFTTDGLTKGNALYASAALGYVLTDNALGTFVKTPWLTRELYLPQLVVSRMVETPAEIVRQYQRFVASGGQIAPSTVKALTASIDFLVEGGNAIAAGVGAVAGGGSTTLQPASLWDAAAVLTNSTGKTLWSLNGHSDHYRLQPQALAGAEPIVTSSQLLPAVPDGSVPGFAGLVSFTMGCNAGLNVDDRLSGDALRRRDHAQAYAQQQAAYYLANLGFGYGETLPGGNGLSEKWMSLYAQRLGEDSTVGVKKLLTDHAYFQQMGTYGVFDEKVIVEVAAYGPPWYRFAGGPSPPAHTPPATTTGPAPGLTSATVSFDVQAQLQRHDDPQRGSFWTAGGNAHFAHYRMPQPVVTRNVTVPGLQARGAGLTALVTNDVLDVDPFLSTPTVFSAAAEPEPTHFDDAIYPANFASINTSFPFGQAQDTLVLLAGQYRPSTPPGPRGIERLVHQATYEVFYAEPGNSDRSPPLFLQSGSNLNDDGTATIWARAIDRGSGIKRIAAVWTRGGTAPWTSTLLTPVEGTSALYAATIPTSSPVHALYWAVDGGANTSYTTGKGFLITTRPRDATAPAIRVTQPASGGVYTLGATVPASYACTDPNGVRRCDGTVVNRTPFTTATVGEQTFTVVAADLSGNETTKTVTYRVGYGFPGFSAPVDAPPSLNAAQAGRTIPVRWKLTRSDGTVIRDLAAVASITSHEIDCDDRPAEPVPDDGTTGTTSSLTITGDEFHYQWRTDRAWAGTCRRLVVRLSDGTAPFADFRFK